MRKKDKEFFKKLLKLLREYDVSYFGPRNWSPPNRNGLYVYTDKRYYYIRYNETDMWKDSRDLEITEEKTTILK